MQKDQAISVIHSGDFAVIIDNEHFGPYLRIKT